MVVILLVFAMLFHAIYYKMRWVDDAEPGRQDMYKVGCKVQDLELKINILTYKMQYGTWPLPHQIHSPGAKGLRNIKFTLSSTSGHQLWNKPFLNCERNATCLAFSKHRLRSMQHLKKLIDLETKYISSQFDHDVSSFESNLESFHIARSSRTISDRSSCRTSRTLRSSKKDQLKPKQLSKSEHLEIPAIVGELGKQELQTKTHMQIVRSLCGSKLYEKWIKPSDECRKYIEEIKASNRSLGLMNSSTELSDQNSFKDVGVETQPQRFSCLIDSKAWYEFYKQEGEESRKSHESGLKVSNRVTAVTKRTSDSSRNLPTDVIFGPNDNSPRKKKSRILPPGLSITFLTDKYQSFSPRDKCVTTVHQRQGKTRDSTRDSTSEILCKVKEKLESLHDVKDEHRDNGKSSSSTIASGKMIDTIFQNAFNFKKSIAEDAAEKNCEEKSTASCDTAIRNDKEQGESDRVNQKTYNWSPIHLEENVATQITEDDEENDEVQIEQHDIGSNTRSQSFVDDDLTVFGTQENINEDRQVVFNSNYLPSSNVKEATDSTSNTIRSSSANSSPRNTKMMGKVPDDSINENVHCNRHTDALNLSSRYLNMTGTNRQNILNDKNKQTINIRSVEERKIIPWNRVNLLPNSQIPMETDDDLTIISGTSSITEFSKDSDLDEKSTGTLLREALEFKEALLVQIERETQKGMERENEGSKCDSDEASKNKNDNHFQSKLLDSISEEHSASSSTERTSNTYVVETLSTGRNSCNLPKRSTVNAEKQSSDETNLEYDSCGGSKTLLTATSSEYFSVNNATDNEQTSDQNTEDSVAEQEFDKANLNDLEPDEEIVSEPTFEEDLIDWTSKIELPEETRPSEYHPPEVDNSATSTTEEQRQGDTETLTSTDNEQDGTNEELLPNLMRASGFPNRKDILQQKQEFILNVNSSVQNFYMDDQLVLDQQQQRINKNYNDSNRLKNINELFNGTTMDMEEIDNCMDDGRVQDQMRGINDLVLKSVQNIRNFAELFSQSQNEAIVDTQKAILHQRKLLNNCRVEDDWSLNFLEPDDQLPLHQMTESSSDESIKRFVNALGSHDCRNVETIAEQKLMMLNATEIEGRNFAAAGESFKYNSNLALKRHRGTFSLGDLNTSGHSTAVTRKILNIVADPDPMFEAMSETEDFGDNYSDLSSIVKSHSKAKYDSEKLQRKQDIITKLKTLDAFTKPLEISECNSEKTEIGGEGSPLTGRTVINTSNELENVAASEGEIKDVDQLDENVLENEDGNFILESNGGSGRNIDDNIPSLSIYNASKLVASDKIDVTDKHEDTSKVYAIKDEEKPIEDLNSNFYSDSSSLYFTDDASKSNIKLDTMKKVQSRGMYVTNGTETNEENFKNVNETTTALTKLASTSSDDLIAEERKSNDIITSKVNTRIACMSMMDVSKVDIKPFDYDKTQSVECSDSNELCSDDSNKSYIINKSVGKQEKSGRKMKLSDSKKIPPVTEKTLSVSSNINLKCDASEFYVGKRNMKFAVSSVILTSDKSALTPNLYKTRHFPPASSTNLSSNTSTLYVDMSNHDLEASSNVSLIPDDSILNPPPNRLDLSALSKSNLRRKSTFSCVEPNHNKISANIAMNSPPKLPKPVSESKKIKKSPSNSDNAMVNANLHPCRIPSRELAVQKRLNSKQEPAKKPQLTVKSYLNLPTARRKSQICARNGQLSTQSTITLTQERSQSHVTPRKSQFSARSSGNLDLVNSTCLMDLEDNESKASVPSSKAKPVTGTSSRSCIPILKTRMESLKKTEVQARSRSPVRGPLTIRSLCRENCQRICTTVQGVNQNIIEAPFGIGHSEPLPTAAYRNMPEGEEGEIIEYKSKASNKIQEAVSQMENTGLDVIPKECTVIYVNVVTDNEHCSETDIAEPKDVIRYACDRNLTLSKAQSRSNEVSLEKPKVQGTISAPGSDAKNSTSIHLLNTDALQVKHGTPSKLLSTNTLKGSQFVRVEHREIEVSAKPSVIDTSTSVSGLPTGENMQLEKARYETFDIPKELTEEEHVMLLETLEKDPYCLEGRRTHKLYNKLGLGFQTQPEHS